MNLNLPTYVPPEGPAPGSLCVKCQRPALYVVVRDGTLLCEECAPGVKCALGDWLHKEVRPLPNATNDFMSKPKTPNRVC